MAMTDAENRPAQLDPFTPPARSSLGPGYDWILELLRQLFRPALGLVCIAGIARHVLFAVPADRLDEMSLLIITGLAGALAGIRAAEMTLQRPGR